MKLVERKILKADKKYRELSIACDEVLEEIKKMLIFEHEDINIFHQAGDGLVLEFESRNVSVDHIVKHYEQYGKLTFEDLLMCSI